MRIGTVTPGQSPRDDIVPEIESYLTEAATILEAGALDGISKGEIAQGLLPESDDDLLVTRMRDGSSVTISEKKITPLVQRCVEKLEKQGARIILLLCTGNFPTIQSRGLLIKAGDIFTAVVRDVSLGHRIGVMIPDKAQVGRARRKWGGLGMEIEVAQASPYASIDAVQSAAERLRNDRIKVIAMDCLGYNKGMKELVRKTTDKPVVLPRSILARVLSELL